MSKYPKIDLLYVARDSNGELWAFKSKPFKSEINGAWMSNDWHIKLDSKLYPNVKWEDEEPNLHKNAQHGEHKTQKYAQNV